MSGLASISGGKEQPPTPVGTAAVDQHGAVLAAFGIVSALLSREKTGKGRKVESNLLNAAIDLQIEPLTYYLNKGPLWERSETGLATQFHQAPYGIYQTANGWIGISMTPIDKLMNAFGTDSLAGYTPKDQMEKREEVNRIVVEEVKKRTTEDWYKIFEENEIWHAPVNGYEEIEKDPQVEWNKMIITAQHPDVGQIRLLNHPVRYEDYEIEVKKYPPRLGEHTNEVLEEYGFSQEEIESYLSKGITVNSMLSKGENK